MSEITFSKNLLAFIIIWKDFTSEYTVNSVIFGEEIEILFFFV